MVTYSRPKSTETNNISSSHYVSTQLFIKQYTLLTPHADHNYLFISFGSLSTFILPHRCSLLLLTHGLLWFPRPLKHVAWLGFGFWYFGPIRTILFHVQFKSCILIGSFLNLFVFWEERSQKRECGYVITQTDYYFSYLIYIFRNRLYANKYFSLHIKLLGDVS